VELSERGLVGAQRSYDSPMTVDAPPAPTVDRGPGRHRRPHRRLPLWITIIGWVLVVPLLVVAAMRLFTWDRFEFFTIVNDVTLFVYLPAWIVAAVALVGRRFVLAGAAIIVVVAQVVFVLPEWTAAQPVPSWAVDAPSIRLFDANVYYENSSMSGYASEIKQYRPQLLTMEEAVPPLVSELKSDGALAGLPNTVQIERYDPFAFLIACKYPLTDVHVVTLYGRPLIVQTTIQLPSGPEALWLVHAIAPVNGSFSEWKGQLADINRLLRARGPAGLLLVGDFNATWGSKGFRTILDAGMEDGAAARGHPLEMTWSQIEHPLPPFVRIDHVLTGPGVAVTQISTGSGPGSDHRDVRATVAVRQ
jgi:endonuclease/exonuclease/phosphatase (EEP) superfamily protein YafD